MKLWSRFLQAVGFQSPPPAEPALPVNDILTDSIQAIATREQRSEAEVTADLLAGALLQQDRQAELERRWQSLTERQREVALLICQGWSYRQMGAHLYVSSETIKAHVSRILRKFGVRRMSELRLLLQGWQSQDQDKNKPAA